MSEIAVAYCGGKMSSSGYISPRKENVSNIVRGGSIDTSEKNETDADAYIFDGNTLHVFKSQCSPKMVCTYRATNDKIITDEDKIWKAVIKGGNGTATIMADSDDFYIDEKRYEDITGITEATFSFVNVNGDMPTATNVGMFSGNTDLISCKIPGQMRNISDETFSGCTYLTSYTTHPDFIDTIGENAFAYCTSLRDIVIGRYTIISSSSFTNCIWADNIVWNNIDSGETLPRMTEIPDSAFKGCTNLFSTVFSGGSISATIYIPNGIERIGDYAFSGCSSFKYLVLPSSLMEIGDSAFDSCSWLIDIKTKQRKGGSHTEINDYAFYDCSSLETVEFNFNTTINGQQAFKNTSSLSSIIFNEEANLDGQDVFENSGIKELEFNGDTTIGGSGMFSGCNLNSITFNADATIGHEAFRGVPVTSLTIQIGEGVKVEREADSFDEHDDFNSEAKLMGYTYDPEETPPDWVEYYELNNWDLCIIKDKVGNIIYDVPRQSQI